LIRDWFRIGRTFYGAKGFLQIGNMAQSCIPANLQLPGDQTIVGIGGFVTPLGEARLITYLFQFERKSLHPSLFLINSALCCLNGSFDCTPLDSTEHLGYNSLFWLGTSEGNARLSSVNDPQSSAHVTYEIATPTVIGVQHAATPAAPQKAG
jgi:hypothetical protein